MDKNDLKPFQRLGLLEPDEPEKVVLLIMAGLVLLFPTWRVLAARR